MEHQRGWWWLLTALSLPFLLLARTGLFGPRAREEADTALDDLSAFGGATSVVLGVTLALVLAVLLFLGLR
jgi:hypothetical protein